MSVESGSRNICPDYNLHNDGCSTTPYIKEAAAGEAVRGPHCTVNVFVVTPQSSVPREGFGEKTSGEFNGFLSIKEPPSFLELME